MKVRYCSDSPRGIGHIIHEDELEWFCNNPDEKARKTLGKVVALLVKKGLISTEELLKLYPLPYGCYGFELVDGRPDGEVK